ncbi:hypothetical protein PFUM301598_18340 [Pseudomonas fluorescens]
MMNERLIGFSLTNSLLQCPDHRLRMQAAVHMMTHDFAGVRVCYQADVSDTFPRWEIGNVCDPNLLRSAGYNLFRASFE